MVNMANNVKEKIKLDQAYINYHNIIDKKLFLNLHI